MGMCHIYAHVTRVYTGVGKTRDMNPEVIKRAETTPAVLMFLFVDFMHALLELWLFLPLSEAKVASQNPHLEHQIVTLIDMI